MTAETVVERPPFLDDPSTARLGSFQTHRWLTPLPPALERRVPAGLRKTHGGLVKQIEATRHRIAVVEAELEEARADDARAAVDAVSAGQRDLPEPKAAPLEEELEQLRRVEAAFPTALVESGNRMLQAVAGELDQARDELGEAVDAELAELPVMVAALRERSEKVGPLNAESRWISTVQGRHFGAPWGAGHQGHHAVSERVTRLLAELDVELERVIAARHARPGPGEPPAPPPARRGTIPAGSRLVQAPPRAPAER
jgi:hypothetical protein